MHLRRETGERTCFVHVGAHKTGTTAIQRFLAGNRDVLAHAGLSYPQSGRLSAQLPGHHNVAFELTGDPQFDRARGTLGDVTRELAGVQPRHACISSEVFQYLHVDDAGLVALRDALASAGFRPRIVLYVRAQDEYLESLYAELAKHGLLLSFADFTGTVMGHGIVRYGRGWAFRFDYTKLADRFASVFGADAMIVRNYDDGGCAGSLVRDFLAAVGVTDPAAADAAGAQAAYENQRLTTGGIIDRLFRNAAADLRDDRIAAAGADLVARYPREAGAPFRPLSPGERARVTARFADDNERLARRWPAAAGIARRHPTVLEAESARDARRLFEHAEALRRTFAEAAGASRSGGASGG
jgi:hypothetical protein